ncbi:AMIN-like domain-containing (lipo)protein [Oryzihumus sp.]
MAVLAAGVMLAGCTGGGSAGPTGSAGATTSGTTPSASATAIPTATPTPSPGCTPFGSTAAKGSTLRPGEQLSGITGSSLRTARHPCFDRVVLEFRGPGLIPGWYATYTNVLRGEQTGEPITPALKGNAFIDVTFGAWYTGEPVGRPAFSGPQQLLPVGYPALREVRILDGFEGVSRLGIGVDQKRPFQVAWLKDPYRMVVDIYTGVL